MAANDSDSMLARAAGSYRKFFEEISRRFPERGHIIEQIELALLSREHVLIFGPPGTGKSELAATVLRNIVDANGAPSLYARQIVETSVQQDLIGPVDFKVLTETGRTQHRLEEGLLAFEHAVLDEVFDARDLLLRSIFSVLHEREFAVGPQVIRARLGTALFTTNRYLSELLASRPETLLAFSDRVAFAGFVPKGFVEGGSRLAVLAHAAGRVPPLGTKLSLTDLAALRTAAAQVEIDDAALGALSGFADVFEKMLQESGPDRKQPPTRYLSGRALAKAVGIWKAAVLRARIRAGTARPLRATAADLPLLGPFFTLGAPPSDRHDAYAALTSDPRDQAQLKLAGLEQAAFQRALKDVQARLRQDLQREAAELGLAEIFRPDLAANRTLVGALAAGALARARHAKHRDELARLLRGSATAYLAEGARPLSGSAQLERVGQLTAMIGGLHALDEGTLALRVAQAARAEMTAEVIAAPLVEMADEFEASRPISLQDLTGKVAKRIEQFESAEKRIVELAALAGEPIEADLSALIASARARTARALRRRAGALVSRSKEGSDLSALPGEVVPLAEIDSQLEALSPGSGKLRMELVTARAAGLLRRELAATTIERPAVLLDFLRDADRRLRTLEIEPSAVLRALRPAIGTRLASWLEKRPGARAPTAPYSEEGYLALVARCSAASEHAAVSEIARLVSADGDQATTHIRARLEELELAEVSAQVLYLETWFAQLAASVPAPGELVSLPQAEAAWTVLSASRFYRQAWRDQEMVSLRARLTQLATGGTAAGAQEVAARLEELLRKSEHFGRALLDRRAALSSAA